ncbi:MAG: hypothetical protein ACP5HM_05640 [Anaerolineae bacterium]
MSKRGTWLALGMLGAFLLLVAWSAGVHADETLPPNTSAGPCKPWVQVNDGGFGLDSGGDYTGEEGFEVVVFNGQLYLGMEADNDYGARLWRTKPGVVLPNGQADWEEVAEIAGEPFGNSVKDADGRQNDHIDSLAVFNGVLYASNANGGTSKHGTTIYSSTTGNPLSWHAVITAGFGYTENTNFKDMQVFDGWLCGGTQNATTGAQVWCTGDGSTWVQKNESGFGDSGNSLIASSGVFSGVLYVGVAGSQGSVWRTSDLATWTKVLTVTDRPRVEIVGTFSDTLYVAAGANDGRNAGDPTIRLYRSSTGDPGSWDAPENPLDDEARNTRTIVDGGTVYNGALYIATMNTLSGTQVWRTTDGVTWTQVNSDGFGTMRTFAAELISFNGYLYAWASNYTIGQQVWRTACPMRQSLSSPALGNRYEMPGVGAVLTLTQGTPPETITVSVYPGAYPTAQKEDLPIARTYEITPTPVTAVFTADLTLSYTEQELESSDANSDTLRLTRWDAESRVWLPCAESQTERDPIARTVTCRQVTEFSTWAFSSDTGQPTSLHVIYLAVVMSSSGALPILAVLNVAVLVLIRCGFYYR